MISRPESHRFLPRVGRPGLSLALVLVSSLLAACATSDFGSQRTLRPAREAPDRFVVGTFTGTETREAVAGEGCRSPMVDPRDGTRLRLVRSSRDVGDYAVPDGRYGVGGGEYLRLDCDTGAALGIASR